MDPNVDPYGTADCPVWSDLSPSLDRRKISVEESIDFTGSKLPAMTLVSDDGV